MAVKLVLDKLIPSAKELPVSLSLPKVEGAADLPAALSAVMAAVAQGGITPGEGGQTLTGMLEAYRKGLELMDLDARVDGFGRKKRTVRSTKARIAKLESRNPKEPLVFHLVGFGRDVLTVEEESALRAAEEQLKRETKNGLVFVDWTKEEAQRLMLGMPPRKFPSWKN